MQHRAVAGGPSRVTAVPRGAHRRPGSASIPRSIGASIASPGRLSTRSPGRLSGAVRAVLLSVALAGAAGVAAAPTAAASDLVPPTSAPGPNDDGSCDTRPTTYPSDGDPIPVAARCAVIAGADGSSLGEVWAWESSSSVRWYNYASAEVTSAPEGDVMMCGSTSAATDYTCSADSSYLLFAVNGLFVEWATPPAGDLHFCQRVSFGTGATAVAGDACATIERSSAGSITGAPPVETVPPVEVATSAPALPPATESAPESPAPATEPVEPGATDEPASTEVAPSDPAATPADTGPGTDAEPGSDTPSAGAEPVPVESDGAPAAPSGSPSSPGDTAGAPVRPGVESDAAQTPVTSESIAVVGGAGFPLGFALVLAGALAVGGYLTLATPAVLAARRRRG